MTSLEKLTGLKGCNMNIPHFSVERTASPAKVGWKGVYLLNAWIRIKLYISACEQCNLNHKQGFQHVVGIQIQGANNLAYPTRG